MRADCTARLLNVKFKADGSQRGERHHHYVSRNGYANTSTHRRVELLKALCACVDAVGKLFPGQEPATLLCKGSTQGLRSALDAAADRAGNSGKVDALLQRLGGLLEAKH